MLKITKIQNSISSLFLSDLHQIFTVLFEIFYSFYPINLNLDHMSPLILKVNFKIFNEILQFLPNPNTIKMKHLYKRLLPEWDWEG